MEDQYRKIFSDINNILVVVAHPDDFEMIFAGTAARLIKDGKTVRLLVCTNGSTKDNSMLVETRKLEQLTSSKIIGIPENEIFILDFNDCSLVDTDESLIEKIVFHIREFRPDLIVTHQFQNVIENIEPDFLWVAHRDHRAVGVATLNSIMPMASSDMFFKHHLEAGLKTIEVLKLLTPDLVNGKVTVDITEVSDLKKQALKVHKSQMDEKYADELMENHEIEKGHFYVEKFKYYELGYKAKN